MSGLTILPRIVAMNADFRRAVLSSLIDNSCILAWLAVRTDYKQKWCRLLRVLQPSSTICHNTNHGGEIVHLTMSAVVISCTGSSIILQDNLKSLYRKQQFLAKSTCSPLNIVENFSQVSQKLCLSSHIHCTCLFTTNQSYNVFCISLGLSTRDLWWKLGAKNLFITYKYQNKVVIRITLSLVYFR